MIQQNSSFQSKKQAEAIVGSLSKPSKMPGLSYGIPASSCKVGQKLASMEGSVCSNCYALKGFYVMPTVKAAQQKRLNSLTHPLWTDAMTYLIGKSKCDYFRWHDSGDLQSLEHLKNIVQVAENLPEVKFWLPTREAKLITTYLKEFQEFPDNLIVRVSGAMIDGAAPVRFIHTSTVVSTSNATCPAPQQGNKCGSCRACWDKSVATVSYREH